MRCRYFRSALLPPPARACSQRRCSLCQKTRLGWFPSTPRTDLSPRFTTPRCWGAQRYFQPAPCLKPPSFSFFHQISGTELATWPAFQDSDKDFHYLHAWSPGAASLCADSFGCGWTAPTHGERPPACSCQMCHGSRQTRRGIDAHLPSAYKKGVTSGPSDSQLSLCPQGFYSLSPTALTAGRAGAGRALLARSLSTPATRRPASTVPRSCSPHGSSCCCLQHGSFRTWHSRFPGTRLPPVTSEQATGWSGRTALLERPSLRCLPGGCPINQTPLPGLHRAETVTRLPQRWSALLQT